MGGIGWVGFRFSSFGADDSDLASAGSCWLWFLLSETGSGMAFARSGNWSWPFSGLDGKAMVDHGESVGVELGLFPF